MSDHDDTEQATADADAANGEPDALNETHRTGEQQAHANRENDPPA